MQAQGKMDVCSKEELRDTAFERLTQLTQNLQLLAAEIPTPQPKPPNVVPEEDLARRARHQEWLVAVRHFKNSGRL
jgi:hypothetical protein